MRNAVPEREIMFATRREFLQLAAGLGLSFTVPGLELRAASQRGAERKKSLITVWLAGGPSQLETWDPHPGTAIGGPTKAIATRLPEVQIADLYPRVAQQIQHMSVIRSLVSKEGDHERGTHAVRTGYRPDPTLVHPSLGAIAVHELPAAHVEIPQYISLGAVEFPARGGYLGDRFDPYRVVEPGKNGQNLTARVETERQARRLKSLDVVGQSFAQGRRQKVDATLHRHTIDAALKMMTSEQLKAFEISGESAETTLAYGDSELGRGCLVARRLVETGVRSIEVTLSGFDSHGENFLAHRNRARDLDPALAALVADLVERDLWQSTVVLVIGEFGRTPKINPLDGRDHWPTGFSCLVGGGGLKAGQLIGATDPLGEKTAPTDPVEIPDLYATILHVLGIGYQQEIMTPVGRPMKLCSGKVLPRLVATA